MIKDFEGIYIPKEIFIDTNLTPQEKIYLSILKMDLEIKTSKEFAELMFLSVNRLSEIKKSLQKKGYIVSRKNKSPQEVKQLALDSKNKGKICEWCKEKVVVLHEHHYPISKKDGGEDTVRICPNCHYSFHYFDSDEVTYE